MNNSIALLNSIHRMEAQGNGTLLQPSYNLQSQFSSNNDPSQLLVQNGSGVSKTPPSRGFGLPFNPIQFGIPRPNIDMDGLELATDFLDNAFGLSQIAVGYSLKNPIWDYYRMNLGGPKLNTPSNIKFQRLAYFNKVIGKIATPLSVLTTGYSFLKVIEQYNSGGWGNVDKLDFADGTVGTIGIGLYILGVTNPWIGGAILLYGGIRLGMDAYNYYHKP